MSKVKYPDITVDIIGQDSNAFMILGICIKAMKRAHLSQEEINEFKKEATSGDYYHLLATVDEYFNVE